MKILYGVQGTGNGHITRARMLAKHFSNEPVSVDFLFTGRKQKDFFDMSIFGDYLYRQGLTFHSEKGRLNYFKTLKKNNLITFVRDVMQLDVAPYDLIITDFEPVSAWAGRLSGKKVIGIGHQYAFGYDIPLSGENVISRFIMRYFSPASISVGLHWDKFDAPILPPIIDNSLTRVKRVEPNDRKVKNILVYLPFEDQKLLQDLLVALPEFIFTIYSQDLYDHDNGNLKLRKASHDKFKSDLVSTDAVICGSGFELISECLHLGLPILTKPQAGQMEQQSNAAALEQLQYATVFTKLDPHVIQYWCNRISEKNTEIKLPDVAAFIVDWICREQHKDISEVSHELWSQIIHS